MVNIVLDEDRAAEAKLLKAILRQPADLLAQNEVNSPNSFYRRLGTQAAAKITCQDYNRLQAQLAKIYQLSSSNEEIDSLTLIRLID